MLHRFIKVDQSQFDLVIEHERKQGHIGCKPHVGFELFGRKQLDANVQSGLSASLANSFGIVRIMRYRT